jgi:hypothetical protein
MTPLRVAVEGRWLDWSGLDPGLTDEDVVAAFDVDASAVEYDTARVSSRIRRRRTVRSSGEPVLEWWLGDEGSVLMAKIVDPACEPGLEQVLAGLGPPDREGAGRHLVSGGTTTEYVWPGRGLSLTVVESYEDPPAWPPRLASSLLFGPTDLGGFIVELGGNDRAGPSW